MDMAFFILEDSLGGGGFRKKGGIIFQPHQPCGKRREPVEKGAGRTMAVCKGGSGRLQKRRRDMSGHAGRRISNKERQEKTVEKESGKEDANISKTTKKCRKGKKRNC